MGKTGRDRAPSPVNPGDSATTRQEVCHEGPAARSRWGGYQLARPGGPPGPEERVVPEKSNLKAQTTAVRGLGSSCLIRPGTILPWASGHFSPDDPFLGVLAAPACSALCWCHLYYITAGLSSSLPHWFTLASVL